MLMEASLWPFLIDFVDKGGNVAEFSTFWIKNLLIPYLSRGNTTNPMEKRGFVAASPAPNPAG
jgi:hypothetical protein